VAPEPSPMVTSSIEPLRLRIGRTDVDFTWASSVT
jgi:hypothetical protein